MPSKSFNFNWITICHNAILRRPQHNFMLFKNWLWHLRGVAAKYFSVIHAPAKRIFRVYPFGFPTRALSFQIDTLKHMKRKNFSVLLPSFPPAYNYTARFRGTSPNKRLSRRCKDKDDQLKVPFVLYNYFASCICSFCTITWGQLLYSWWIHRQRKEDTRRQFLKDTFKALTEMLCCVKRKVLH